MSLAVPGLPLYLVHWNAPQWCASAVRSILESERIVVEVTVIDNGQESGPLLSDLLPSEVRVLRMSRNTGYTGGANAALRDWRETRPQADLCAIGSHDLHVAPDALRRLVDAAREHGEFGIVGPAFTSPKPSYGGTWNGWSGERVPTAEGTGLLERDWLPGACLLIRRELIERIGELDERFDSYTEDKDLCLRAKDAGWKVGVLPEARAWGLGQVSPERATPLGVANGVMLVAKRRGLGAASMKLGRVVASVFADTGGTLALWRGRDERRESRRRLKANIGGVRRVARNVGTVIGMARERRMDLVSRRPSVGRAGEELVR